MPKPGVIKFDPVTEAVRRTNGIQQPDILVHANVLQRANICGADTLQKLRDPFPEGPDEVLSEEPKLYVQIMLRVVVTPINFVPSEKGSLRCQDVFLCWYNAERTKIVRWIVIVILAS